MKSKKKLIYKLHENINQNPFKTIDQVSFRNAGTGSYDYNKLKSIRAISLRGLGSDQIHDEKHASDWKQKYDLKMNMVSIKEEIKERAQQALICNRKKMVVDKSLISMQPKKLNVRTLLKEKHFQVQRREGHNVEAIRSTQNYEQNYDENTNNFNQKTKIRNQQKQDQDSQRLNNHGHSRNVSLPTINNHKQDSKNSMTFISPNKQLDTLFEEQRAKQQILKQIRLNAQEKINKQVLMSIKLKSIQNLERIARSQSEVIKIDKWKEKYSQLKNGSQITSREKNLSPKNFLPQIQQKLYNKDGLQYPSHKIKPSHRYMQLSDEQQGQFQKSDIQLAKDSLYNATIFEHLAKPQEPIFSYNSTLLYRKSPDIVYESAQYIYGHPEVNYKSQVLIRHQLQTKNLLYSQPLKLTITKLKGKKNKHNQNLYAFPMQNDKSIKQMGKRHLNSNHQHIEVNNCSTQIQQRQLQRQTPNFLGHHAAWRQQNPTSPIEQFRTKSKLYTGTEKGQAKHEQHYSVSHSVNHSVSLSLRRNHELKCKINEEHNILDKIVEDGMPQEWKQNKFNDQELTDFDNFVQNQAKQAGEQ